MKKRFTEAQIVGFLREAGGGIPVKDLCRKHGFSDASYYLWRSKFGGMSVSDAKRLKELEIENTRLKKLLADSLLENEVTREVLRKMYGPPPCCNKNQSMGASAPMYPACQWDSAPLAMMGSRASLAY
jgi:putative transposase